MFLILKEKSNEGKCVYSLAQSLVHILTINLCVTAVECFTVTVWESFIHFSCLLKTGSVVAVDLSLTSALCTLSVHIVW